MVEDGNNYGLSSEKSFQAIPLPFINYQPPKPKKYNPGIALIGTGEISAYHLKNYRDCGFRVVALCNRKISKAEAMRDKFYPTASVYSDYRELLKRDDIEVIDVTPHPSDRLPIIYDCLHAGKHILSQKPFVLKKKEGKKLVDLADRMNLKLAINQNGRWSPHFSFMRNAIKEGLVGKVNSIDFSIQWDHTWVKNNSSFNEMNDLILFDFGIHWFDITSCFMAEAKPEKIYASTLCHSNQVFQPPALAAVIIDYPQAQVRMSFNGHCKLGEEDVTTIIGTEGTIRARGTGLNEQNSIELFLKEGCVNIPLSGSWFVSGFQGSMGELLCSIEEDREPLNSARDNLETLNLCLAAKKSVTKGAPVKFS